MFVAEERDTKMQQYKIHIREYSCKKQKQKQNSKQRNTISINQI